MSSIPKNQNKKNILSSCQVATLKGHCVNMTIIGYNCNSATGTIDLIFTLWNHRMDKNVS